MDEYVIGYFYFIIGELWEWYGMFWLEEKGLIMWMVRKSGNIMGIIGNVFFVFLFLWVEF